MTKMKFESRKSISFLALCEVLKNKIKSRKNKMRALTRYFINPWNGGCHLKLEMQNSQF